MNRHLAFLIALILLSAIRADADIAPNPVTGGWPISPYQDAPTDVRMVAEDVRVRIYPDSIVTVAIFRMRNDGKTTEMPVGFPDPGGFVRFRVLVDGRPQTVRDGSKEYPRPDGSSQTAYWKLWDVKFREGKACEIGVEYKTKPSMLSFMFRPEEEACLPADVLAILRESMTFGNAEYILETGSPWKGVLDKCRVSFEFTGMPHVHIKKYSPNDGVSRQGTTGGSVVWEYKDYEPSGQAAVEYSVISPGQQAEIFKHVMKRFPDAPIASAAGRFYGAYLGRDDLKRNLYHSFLAKWDEPIPQLMEYASGGRCRVDYGNKKGILTVWSMAWDLFQQYKEIGQIESGRDIAPTVSRISGAYVDSLSTCNGLSKNDEWLLREATSLRDVCNDLMRK